MKIIIALILSFGLFNSCSKEDLPVSELEGKWILESAVCFCYFGEDFDFSQHTLDFDNSSQNVTITNPESTFFVSQSNTYSFSLDADLITFEDGNGYFYEIKDSKLILTKDDNPAIADDELTLIYKR